MADSAQQQVIAIVGGTFDPIHFGHLRLAEELADLLRHQLVNSNVRLMPAADPPHRGAPVASAQHRAAMVKLAIARSDSLLLDERELARGGASYSYLSVVELTDENPDAKLIWVLGDDAFAGLAQWRQWKALAKVVSFIVVGRPGCELSYLPGALSEHLAEAPTLEHLLSTKPGCYWRFSGPNLGISSTQIRELMQQNRSCRFLLPDSVIEYIKQHRLYGN